MNPGDDKREFGPDILRALAIILVVFAHSLIYLDHIPFVQKYSLHIASSCAVWRVEIFFVLSGYLI